MSRAVVGSALPVTGDRVDEMPKGSCHRNTAAPRRSFQARWQSALPHALLLTALLLMPVQMRAGAGDPHPHALVQVLLDASDGEIDHHASKVHAAGAHVVHAGETGESRPHHLDTPSFEKPSPAASGMPILAALVAVLIFPGPDERQAWPAPAPRRGLVPALEPPPPRMHVV